MRKTSKIGFKSSLKKKKNDAFQDSGTVDTGYKC